MLVLQDTLNYGAGFVALILNRALGMPRAQQTSSAGHLGFGSASWNTVFKVGPTVANEIPASGITKTKAKK